MAEPLSLLEAGASHWVDTGELDPELLCDGDLFVPVIDGFVGTSPGRMLFVAALLLAREELEPSARWFARAFTVCPDLMRCDEADQLDDAAGGMAPSSSLAAIMATEKPEDGILRVLQHRQSKELRVAREYDAFVAQKVSFPCTIQEAAQYCYSKIVESGKPWGEEYLVHKALFWAMAGWAQWKRAALTQALPERAPNGPWFSELAGLLKQFRDGTAQTIPRIRDADVLRVLDAAVAHVRTMPWRQACDETHIEPLWIITPAWQPMATIVDVYSERDATGALHAIFPWMFAESASAGGCCAAGTAPRIAVESTSRAEAGVAAGDDAERGETVVDSAAAPAHVGSKRPRDIPGPN